MRFHAPKECFIAWRHNSLHQTKFTKSSSAWRPVHVHRLRFQDHMHFVVRACRPLWSPECPKSTPLVCSVCFFGLFLPTARKTPVQKRYRKKRPNKVLTRRMTNNCTPNCRRGDWLSFGFGHVIRERSSKLNFLIVKGGLYTCTCPLKLL